MNLILYKGNNYYNRKVVYAESDEEYVLQHDFVELAAVPASAFIVGDGIRTTQIVNYDHELYGFGDYVVVYNTNGSIHSRWWVVETVVVREGQVRLSLLRDVLADWYKEVISAPTFIKKGYIQSLNDPAIFNNETMTYNQIKQKEVFIKDKTKCGWYVGYLTKTIPSTVGSIQIPGDSVAVSDTYATLDQYEYSTYTVGSPYIGPFSNICHNFFSYVDMGVNYVAGFDSNGNAKTPSISGYEPEDWLPDGLAMQNDTNNHRGFFLPTKAGSGGFLWDNRFWNAAKEIKNWDAAARTAVGGHTETETTNFFNSQNGKVIQVGGITKKVVIKSTTVSKTVDIANGTTYGQLMYSLAAALGISTTSGIEGNVSSITFAATGYYLDYETIPSTTTPEPYTIPENRTRTADTPYDIFAIPTGPMGIIGNPYKSDPRMSRKVISAFIDQLEGSVLYDVQYVPYCPLSDEFLYDNTIDPYLLNQGSTIDYSIISSGSGGTEDYAWTMIIYASSDSFTKKINAHKIYAPDTVEAYKIENECNMYRLVSPNYNGQFEFSAAKNGGVSGWNISFTYKPFTPYIKVSPIFGRLYGQDFGDARGLICGGDFSLSQTDDAWKSYELNNKNYQVMFDRQIQNMEVNNSVQRELEKYNRIAGIGQGAATGAIAGSMTPAGGYGAVAGALVGGAASAWGGIMDQQLNEKLRKEAINYAQDQFGYQLQNIKALPYSITKVGSQNTDYKIWPFVEYYSCTDVEKAALRSKLRWNGYTIERIGVIENFLNPEAEDTFIQGKLIRLDGIGENSHIIDVINAELQTGVYYV